MALAGDGKKILIVEDDAVESMATAASLKNFGYYTLSARSGEDAVALALNDDSIDLILMDIGLGNGMDGTEAAGIILKSRNIPIVFLSAHSDRETVEKVKGIRRYGYVIKSCGDFVLNSSIELAFELFDAHNRLDNTMNDLSESEEKYRAAFYTSPDAVNINDMEGRYVDINYGFTSLTGYTREEVIGKLSSEIGIWSIPGDRERLVTMLTENGYVSNHETFFRLKDGSLKTGLMSARVIRIKNSPHILSITRDISERKIHEDEINRRNRDLNRLNSELSQMVSELEAANRAFEAVNREFIKTNKELLKKEEAVRHEQLLTDRLLDSLPGIFYLYSYPELRLKRWNKNHEDLLGFTNEEMMDRHVLDWFMPDQKEIIMKRMDNVMKYGYGIVESPLVAKDGSLVQLMMTGVRFESEGDLFMMGVGFDVTELKRAEAERARLLDVIERSLNEIYIFDSHDFKFRYANRGALENLGYSLNEMMEMTPIDIKSGFTRETFDGKIESLLSGEKEREVFFTLHKRKNGTTYPVEVFMQLVRSKSDMFFLAVINDITERKKIEDALSESEERYRTLVQVMPDGIIIHYGGKIVFANEAAHKILRAGSPDQLIGFPIEEYISLACRSEVIPGENCADDNGAENKECIITSFDGSEVLAELTSIPFTYSGKPAVLIIFNDITRRKRDEERIRALLSEKELLLKEVHHRIKNNMNTIKGLLMLQSFTLKEPLAVEALHNAENRVHSMMTLYDKLYRSDSFVELPINEYLPALVNEIAANHNISSSIQITSRVEKFSTDTRVLFPLGIIVNELITNSMKYAFIGRDSGMLTVTASAKGNVAELVIEDNGVGLPDSIDINDSSGFGLQLVSMLTEQIDGELNIERGEGTKFILRFNI